MRLFKIPFLLFFSFIVRAQDPGWPRQLTADGNKLVIYMPQVKEWKDYQSIDFRMAFALTPHQKKQVVGVIYIQGKTDVNTMDHMVKIFSMTITGIHLPSLDSNTSKSMGDLVRKFMEKDKVVNISLERVVACTPKEEVKSSVTLKNDPPFIFTSNTPAVLLQIVGKPGLAPASNENIQYVFNANWPVFYDKAGAKYYLFDNLEWQSAASMDGTWKFISKLPTELVNLKKDSSWMSVLGKSVPAPGKASSKMPKIFYSESPAELIQFDGAPVYNTIKGTELKFATNTSQPVLYATAAKKYYFLSAGRWFSSESLNGPWAFATPYLPADFLKIPHASPISYILNTVPGTDEAADAVMIAQIPNKKTVDAKAGDQVNIVYSGEPKFSPIEGTTMQYAVNTNSKVILVSPGLYYACDQAIWFLASSPTGPWHVAANVPDMIYTIPSSSPVYNVTYVTQVTNVNGTVESSSTSGYEGAYIVVIAAAVIICSGTGYYHPPYMYYPPRGYPVYYAPAMTYGAYAYHSPYHYGGAYGGAGYNSATNTYARGATAYGPYGSASAGQAYNASTGTVARGATASTPYGSASAGQVYNPYTGASGSSRQASGAYGSAGSSSYQNGNGQGMQTAHISSGGQTSGAARTSNGGKAIGTTDGQNTSAAVKTGSGDMYATHNGEVYKNTDGSWEQQGNEGSRSATQTNSQSKQSSSKTSQNTAQTNQGTTQTNQGSTAQTNQGTAKTNQGTSQTNQATTQSKQSSAQTSQTSSSAKTSQSAPNSEMQKASQDRQRGNTETQQYNSSSGNRSNSSSTGSRSGGGGSRGGRR